MTKILIEIDTDTQRVMALVDMIEVVARATYMQWREAPGYVAWVPGGNSLMQDSARRIAATALDTTIAATPQPEPVDVDLRRDAERYRWLRKALSDRSMNGRSHHFCSISEGHPEELNKEIGAAISQGEQK